MNNISIQPIFDRGRVSYRATTGNKYAIGTTAGAALDALTQQLESIESNVLLLTSNFSPDRFFTEIQQQRLQELMELWRDARDKGECLDPAQQTELDSLVAAELRATSERLKAISPNI